MRNFFEDLFEKFDEHNIRSKYGMLRGNPAHNGNKRADEIVPNEVIHSL